MHSQDILKNRIQSAVNLFLFNDYDLLDLKAHEQAISHRIAVYLEPLFKGYNVDCEYNKHLHESKRLDLTVINLEDFCSCGCDACEAIVKNQVPDKKLFRPDILVHARNIDEKNQIAIEIKKNKVCDFDLMKLSALTNQYGNYKYELGVFIWFENSKPEYKWFNKQSLINKTNPSPVQ